MKIADKLAVPAIVIAGGMVYVAEEFNLPRLIPLAMGLFGLFGIIPGVETFASGSRAVLLGQSPHEQSLRLPAVGLSDLQTTWV